MNQEGKVVNLGTFKLLREQRKAQSEYAGRLMTMEKAELLVELLKFKDNYTKNPRDLQSMIRSQMLMEELEKKAELGHLREIANEYKRKLALKIYSQIQSLKAQ